MMYVGQACCKCDVSHTTAPIRLQLACDGASLITVAFASLAGSPSFSSLISTLQRG